MHKRIFVGDGFEGPTGPTHLEIKTMKAISNEVKGSLTVETTEKRVIDNLKSWPKVILADVRLSVDNIPEAAMPSDAHYLMVADLHTAMFKAMFKQHGLANTTAANNLTMAKTAMIEALTIKADKIAADKRLQVALAAQAEKPTKANGRKVTSAEKAVSAASAAKLATSLDTASKAGKAIAARKSNAIKLRNQKPTNKGRKHANPDKAAAAQAEKDRLARNDLIAQALAFAVEVSEKGDLATDKQRRVALKAVAACAKDIAAAMSLTL